jgi:hypothetical protein
MNRQSGDCPSSRDPKQYCTCFAILMFCERIGKHESIPCMLSMNEFCDPVIV